MSLGQVMEMLSFTGGVITLYLTFILTLKEHRRKEKERKKNGK